MKFEFSESTGGSATRGDRIEWKEYCLIYIDDLNAIYARIAYCRERWHYPYHYLSENGILTMVCYFCNLIITNNEKCKERVING